MPAPGMTNTASAEAGFPVSLYESVNVGSPSLYGSGCGGSTTANEGRVKYTAAAMAAASRMMMGTISAALFRLMRLRIQSSPIRIKLAASCRGKTIPH